MEKSCSNLEVAHFVKLYLKPFHQFPKVRCVDEYSQPTVLQLIKTNDTVVGFYYFEGML